MSNQHERVKLHSTEGIEPHRIEIVKKNPFPNTEDLEIESTIPHHHCCGKRSTLEKFLIFLTVSLVLVLLILISGTFIYIKERENENIGPSELLDDAVCYSNKQDGTKKSYDSLCVTSECIAEAHRILSHASPKVNPCDDFFSYACGGWQKEAEIPSDELYHAVNLNVLRHSVDKQLRQLLEVPQTNGELRAFTQIKTFYASCMKAVNFTENTITGMWNLINELGGYQTDIFWRTMQKESSWRLTDLLLALMKHNGAPLFDVSIDFDVKNKSRFSILLILPRQFGLIPTLLRTRRESEADKMIHEFQDTWQTWSSTKRQRHRRTPHVSAHDDYEPQYRMGSSVMPQRMQEPSFPKDDSIHKNSDEHLNDTNHHHTNSQRKNLYNAFSKHVQMEKIASLERHVQTLAEKSGLTDEDQLSREIKKISAFAGALVSIIPSERKKKQWELTHGIYNPSTIDDLDITYNFINWKEFLESLFQTTFSGKEIVYVAYPDYFKTLSLLVKHAEKRILHNTLLSIYQRDVLGELIVNAAKPNRWKFCVQATSTGFGEALAGLYLKQFTKETLDSTRKEVEELFVHIKTEVARGIEQVDWMDENTRKEALAKVHQLRGNFVTPKFYFNNTFIDASMKNFSLGVDDFFGNVMQVYKAFRHELYEYYHEPVEEEYVIWTFVTQPFVVNAFYIQQFNSIVLPLAILTPPHFMSGVPPYINYGTLGTTLAHEILHGFDLIGHTFDANGVLRNWWSPEAKKRFLQDTKCVSEFYSDNFYHDIPVNGQLVRLQFDGNFTVNENSADLGGFKYAYRAYMESAKKLEIPERLLPGVNLTRPQLFFLSTAQAYCSLMSPLAYVFLLELDDHTPHPERVNGVLMNTPEFSEAFNCPLKSPMNPTHKCSLW